MYKSRDLCHTVSDALEVSSTRTKVSPKFLKRGGPALSHIEEITSRISPVTSFLVITKKGMGFKCAEKVRFKESIKDSKVPALTKNF